MPVPSSPKFSDRNGIEGPITSANFLGPKSAARPITAPTSVDYFLASERNRAYANHHAERLPPRQRWLWGLTVLIMLLVIVLIYSAAATINKYNFLKQSGSSTTANVIGHNIRVIHSKNGTTTTYSITYQFYASAGNGDRYQYTASQDVYSDTYFHLMLGASVEVLYSSGDPTNNMIANDSSDYDTAVRTMVFSIATELAGFILLFIFWRRMRNWQRLGRDGVLLTGVLQSASGRWVSGKGAHYELKIAYTFADPQTQESYSKNVTLSRNDLRNAPLPTPGTPLYVIFLGKNNYQLL